MRSLLATGLLFSAFNQAVSQQCRGVEGIARRLQIGREKGSSVTGGTQTCNGDRQGVIQRTPNRAFDGNLNYEIWEGHCRDALGYAHARTSENYLTVDMGSSMALSKITLFPEPAWFHYERMPDSVTIFTRNSAVDEWEKAAGPVKTLENPATELKAGVQPTVTFDPPVCGRHFKFYFPETFCPQRNKNQYCNANHDVAALAELQMFGEEAAAAPATEPPKPTQTVTATATTATTATGTLVPLLHRRLKTLESSLQAGDSEAFKAITADLSTLEGSLLEQININREQEDKIAEHEKSLTVQGDAVKDLSAQVAALTEKFKLLLAPVNRVKSGTGCDDGTSGAMCPPSAESDERSLTLKALAGSVVFESESCGPTDLCELSQDVRAFLKKLDDIPE